MNEVMLRFIMHPRLLCLTALLCAASISLWAQGSESFQTIRLFNPTGPTNGISIVPPSAITAYSLTLPAAQGTANQILVNDGSGNLSWQTGLTTTSGWSVSGNATTDAWNGTSGARLGTTSSQPLVIVTNGAERMRITSAGNVLIGTSSGTNALDIAGNMAATGSGTFGTSTANTPQIIVNGGAGGTEMIRFVRNDVASGGTALTYSWTLAGGKMSFNNVTAGKTTWQTSWGQTLANTAEVNLGSDMPGTSSTPGDQGLLKGSNSGGAGTNVAGGDLYIASGQGTGTATPTSLFFMTPAPALSGTTRQELTTRMMISSGGLVGIGTTPSTAQLQVLSAAAGNVGLRVQGASGQTANLVTVANSAGTAQVQIGPTGNVNIGPFTAESGANDEPLRVSTRVQASGGTEKDLFIGQMEHNSVVPSFRLSLSNYNAAATPQARTQLNIKLRNQGDLVTQATSILLSLRSEGFVGINNIAPATALDVSGTTTLRPVAGGTGLSVRQASGQTASLVDVVSSGGSSLLTVGSSGAVTLWPFGATAGNTNEIRFMELASGGTDYVGFKAPDAIGANRIWTLPSADGTNGQVLVTNGSGTLSWTTPLTSTSGWATLGNSGTSATTNFLGTTDAVDLVIRTNNTERMRFISGGKAVISWTGPSSPQGIFEVQFGNSADAYDMGENAIVIRNTVTSANARMGLRFASGTGTAGLAQIDLINGATTSDGTLAFSTRTSAGIAERMRITNNGLILIGSTSGTNTLDVTGTFRATGLITGSGGATITGATNINTTGTAATTIGNTGSTTTIGSVATTLKTSVGSNDRIVLATSTGALDQASIASVVAAGLTNQAVTSFSASGTGLTPSSATTGAVTLGGTLDVDNGGTGRASATAYMPIVGGTTTTGAQQSVAAGSTTGQALLYQGASAVPSFGAINLAGGSNIVTGTLPVGNGGTGATTATANTVFAGPTTGAAAAPTFRALVAADIPYGNTGINTGTGAQGNFGQFQGIGAYTDFNTPTAFWGWNYVMGNTNAPNSMSSQWYRNLVSLGGDYAATGPNGYALELAFPRYDAELAGVWMRTIEGGNRTSWKRIDAGAGWSLTGNDITEGTHFLGTTTPERLEFRTNNTERMRITSGGNVGIGVTNPDPASMLTISGPGSNDKGVLRITPTGADSWSYASASTNASLPVNGTIVHVFGRDLSGYNAGYIGFNLVGLGSTSNFLSLGHFSSPYLLNVLANGNVGIGTTTPSQKLTLMDGNMYLDNSGTAGELRLREPSAGGAQYTALRAGAQSANITYTLPTTAPTAGQVLSSAADGTMSWATVTGIQFFNETLSSTAPNDVKNAVRWQPKTTTANVDVVLSPLGNGALLGRMPDGTVTGGNKRGSYAVDLQLLGGSDATNVASGNYSTITGGRQNTASGLFTFIGGGNSHIASGQYATIAGGDNNRATADYATVFGGTSNTASALDAVIAGGESNTASAFASSVTGGVSNTASGAFSTVLGGYGLTLSGRGSVGFNAANATPNNLMSVSSDGTMVLGNVNLWLANNDNTARELRFYEAQASVDGVPFPSANTQYTAFKAGVQSANITYTLPTTAPSAGQVLSSATDGTMSWVTGLTASNGWTTTGNASTDSTTAYIGTTDEAVGRPLVFRTDGVERMRIQGVNGQLVALADATVNGVRVGRGSGNAASNTVFGANALASNTSGTSNTAVGNNALNASNGSDNTATGNGALNSNGIGSNNTATGSLSMNSNTNGSWNTATGYYSMRLGTTGNGNTALGAFALQNNKTGSDNIAAGQSAGAFITGGSTANDTASNSVFVGALTKALANNQTNQIVIGYDATGLGSNTVVLGNSSVVTTALRGNVGVGTTAPAVQLHAVNTSATTNAVVDVLRLDMQSSGTPAVGIGTGLEFATETAAGNTEIGSIIESVTTDVAAGTEDFDLVFRTMAGGAAAGERMRVASTGNVTATAFFETSDARLKDVIRRDGNVVYYKWKDGRDDKIHIGYLAQDVQKTHPDQVNTDANGMMSVHYIELLVEKIRQLEKRIEDLEQQKK